MQVICSQACCKRSCWRPTHVAKRRHTRISQQIQRIGSCPGSHRFSLEPSPVVNVQAGRDDTMFVEAAAHEAFASTKLNGIIHLAWGSVQQQTNPHDESISEWKLGRPHLGEQIWSSTGGGPPSEAPKSNCIWLHMAAWAEANSNMYTDACQALQGLQWMPGPPDASTQFQSALLINRGHSTLNWRVARRLD